MNFFKFSSFFYFQIEHPGAFEDEDVTHVEGEVNPVRDIEIINDELRLKDIDMLNPTLDKIEKLVTRGEKKYKVEFVSCFSVMVF